jgi:hypothetical protein
VILALLAGAAAACLLGLAKPATEATHATLKQETLDWIRVVTTTCLAITLVLGPGIAVRALLDRPIRLGFLPLFGIGTLAFAGSLAWCLHGVLGTDTTCFAVVGPVLGLMFGIVVAAGPEDFLSAEEQRTLALLAIPVGLAIARSVWSLGPKGELYEGEISRNLITEPRPDSRTSFIVTAMTAHGTHPYAVDGFELFLPYQFSARGPAAGIASAPVVLVTGGRPILGGPDQPWAPFDPQGFMAYRIAMITMSATALLSMWELVRRLAGSPAARLAIVLGISTPFFFADLIFTWPKLLAASFVLLGALWLFEQRPVRAGLSVGLGYLFHPGALVAYFALAPLALWPLRGAKLRRPQVRTLVLMLVGTGVFVAAWLILNRPHESQSGFLEYVEQAVPHYHPTVWQWISFRFTSLMDTTVPFYLPIIEAHNVSINTLFGTSPAVAHFFFQYWTSVPFAFGIFFFPVLLVTLSRAAKRWTWPFLAVIAIPFVAFLVYWGANDSGLLREGMQAWVLAVVAVLAAEQGASRFSWMRSGPIRLVLVLRAFEVFAVAVGATLGTHGMNPISATYSLNDAIAFAAILLFSALLVLAVWRETAPGSLLGRAAG